MSPAAAVRSQADVDHSLLVEVFEGTRPCSGAHCSSTLGVVGQVGDSSGKR
jgi:hypothetical protein